MSLEVSQIEAAQEIGVRAETVSDWEHDRRGPSVQHLAAIAAAFGDPPEALVAQVRTTVRSRPVRGRPASAYPSKLLTLGDHLRKRRLDLGLTQTDVAKRLGVTTFTVTNWECSHTAPAIERIPKILDLLGYVPLAEPKTLHERIRAYRMTRGLSQVELAGRLGVNPSTVWRWEAGCEVAPALLKRCEALLKGPTDP